MADEHPSPAALWAQAEREFPHLPGARKRRYNALMREHGYILKPGDAGYDESDRTFPCGWSPDA